MRIFPSPNTSLHSFHVLCCNNKSSLDKHHRPTYLKLRNQWVFVWYRLHLDQTHYGLGNKRLAKQLSLSKTAPRYPAFRSAKKSNWRMSLLQQTKHRRSNARTRAHGSDLRPPHGGERRGDSKRAEKVRQDQKRSAACSIQVDPQRMSCTATFKRDGASDLAVMPVA